MVGILATPVVGSLDSLSSGFGITVSGSFGFLVTDNSFSVQPERPISMTTKNTIINHSI